LNAVIKDAYLALPRPNHSFEEREGQPPVLRVPRCQNLFEHLGLDTERAGTFCQGCRFRLENGCPNTRAWRLDREAGVKPLCREEDLVYCRHYDCGCDHCANYLRGTPLPAVARG
jgi:hypothetical protein